MVNLDEKIGKTVGRTGERDSLDQGFRLQRTANTLCRLRVPRGVFRFKSFEEADAWLMNHLTRPAN